MKGLSRIGHAGIERSKLLLRCFRFVVELGKISQKTPLRGAQRDLLALARIRASLTLRSEVSQSQIGRSTVALAE